MKKIYALLLMLIMIVSLCGCVWDPPGFYFDANEVAQAIKVELVVCQNDNPTNVTIEEDTVLFFDTENAKLIASLEQEKIAEFAYDLSSIIFHREYESVNSPIGYAILIYMPNQEITVLSFTSINDIGYGMVADFTNEGEFIRHGGSFADASKFRRLINDYFHV